MAAKINSFFWLANVKKIFFSELYRGPYIDAYCQAWFHLAKLFQRRRLKYEKFNGRTLSDGNISHDGSKTIRDRC
jgi:hypothetical protein